MKTALTVNTKKFINAVKRVTEIGGRPMADILNRNVLKVAIGSGGGKGLVQLTPKATEARIRQDMLTTVTAVDSRGRAHSAPRIILLAAKWLAERGVRKTAFNDPAYNAQVSQACTRIMNARIQSRAYIAAGWLWAASDLAKKTPGTEGLTRLRPKDLPTKGNGTAAQSFSIMAKKDRLFAALYNTSDGAELFTEVIPVAVSNATQDMKKYIETKVGALLARAAMA